MKIDRSQLRKMILKEQALAHSSSSHDINKKLAVEMLKNIIRDLQNVPDHNFDKYIQHLISFQIPNIIQALES
tara:strand:- start:400 stop:618 length:219 start_codon:yes stop_codon:yes gene_type:complete